MNSKLARVMWKDLSETKREGERQGSADPGCNIDEPWKYHAGTGLSACLPVDAALGWW